MKGEHFILIIEYGLSITQPDNPHLQEKEL